MPGKSLAASCRKDGNPHFHREDLAQLQSYAKDLGSHTLEKQALEKLKILLGADQSRRGDADSNKLRDAQRDILQWILALRDDSPQRRSIRALLLGAAMASVLMALGVGILISPIWFLGLFVSILIWWAYILVRSGHQTQISSTQQDNIKRFLPELPENPNPDTLQSGLDQLTEERSQAQLNTLKLNESRRDRAIP